ncbi:MAG: hypothetical protein A2Z25_14800 [Planctomycetes bacterium RBG_16_55_9]|nr:MAG: hypothetical protein A2Z25_14800 [Planctomycetes bacterium RBG_16_55_9]
MVMAIGEDMKKLTENMIVCNDVRLKAVGHLVADTHKTLKGFSTNRKKMAAQQTRDLAHFMDGLSKNVQGMLGSARNMVQQFEKDNMQMSKEQAKSLGDFVQDLVSNVGSLLSSFQKEHNRISKDLGSNLAKEIKDIQTEVQSILDDADKFMHDYRSQMAQARKAWKNMSAALAKARKSGLKAPDTDAGDNGKHGQTSRTQGSGPAEDQDSD